MNFGDIFRLDEGTVRNARRCFNLVVAAGGYALTIVALSLVAIVFSEIMGRLALIVGLDEKSQRLVSYVGAAVFVVLILVSFAMALGDIGKLVVYYIRSWDGDYDEEEPRRDKGSDQE